MTKSSDGVAVATELPVGQILDLLGGDSAECGAPQLASNFLLAIIWRHDVQHARRITGGAEC